MNESDNIRKVILSNEFLDYYDSLSPKIQEKYDYAINIIKKQYVVNKKFVKNIEGSIFYELRISISSNEYRTILFAIDNDSFIESKQILLLNSFLKKDKKQYKQEVRQAEKILKQYI